MPRQIAFLRGINIGPNKRVPMPRLRELLAEHGYEDVKTYVASGNVVLTSKAKPRTVEKELEKLIEDEWGFDVAVIVRTRDELADVIERMPFGDVVEEPLKRLQVSFLSGKPDKENAKKINDACVEPERVAIDGREIYAWHPDGIGRSDLAKLLATKKLGVTVTARNWNTVLAMLELADESSS
jgi:uncharacterized protein (DUF1697 family)